MLVSSNTTVFSEIPNDGWYDLESHVSGLGAGVRFELHAPWTSWDLHNMILQFPKTKFTELR